MKSEKGITLTALVVYIVVFMIILTIMSTISSYFYRNVSKIKDSDKYIVEYNKFSMFFVNDVKNNKNITSMTSNNLEFEDGTVYTYKNSSIYRNDKMVAENVKNLEFEELEHTENEFTKKIVKVKAELGNGNESIIREIDYVLKYW